MKSSPVLREALRLRLAGEAARCRTLDAIRAPTRRSVQRGSRRVETTFVRYSVPLLQVVGTTVVPFLYEVDWREDTTLCRPARRTVTGCGRAGVAFRFVALGPLLRPLIELHSTRDVARWSDVALADAARNPICSASSARRSRPAWSPRLHELQQVAASTCDAPVVGRGYVDHFLA